MTPRFFKLTRDQLAVLKPITDLTTKDLSDSFTEDGFFSERIFGIYGTVERKETFAYIRLNTEIMSPQLFHVISKLSAFYLDIIHSRKFATWSVKKKIFEPSDFENGRTGYTFFVEHVNDIKWNETGSKTRKQKIDSLKKYADVLMLDNYVVIPAGIRDFITKDGKDTEDEINPIYRKLLGLTFLLANSDGFSSQNDIIRLKIQMTIQEIYEHLFRIQDGKGGFINNDWTKRGIVAGTRNVLTASTIKINDLKADKCLGINDSLVGLYQYGMGISTKLDYHLREKFFNRIIGDVTDEYMSLVNPKTMKFEMVRKNKKIVDKLNTVAGLEKFIIDRIKILDYTHKPVMIGKYYLCKVYDDGRTFKVMFDEKVNRRITRNPELEKFIRPITFVELLSIVLLPTVDGAMGLMTRYPITEQGSIYPTSLVLKTTINVREVTILDDEWGVDTVYNNFPTNSQIYTSMAIHHSKLGNLGADFDGDKLNLTILLTEEAKREALKLMMSRDFYVRPDGTWVNPLENKITGFVLKHITRGLTK